MKPFLSILPGFALITTLLSSCASLKEPEFRRIENVKVGSLGLLESNITLDLHYFNPNKTKLKLKEAQGEAWIDNSFLGHFTIDTLIRIPGNAEFSMPVLLRIDMASFLQNSKTVLANKEVLIKIEGKARVGKGGIFINYPIKYEGIQNLEMLGLKF